MDGRAVPGEQARLTIEHERPESDAHDAPLKNPENVLERS
jgi:hypothetical protein